jgi:hypothetical protein
MPGRDLGDASKLAGFEGIWRAASASASAFGRSPAKTSGKAEGSTIRPPLSLGRICLTPSLGLTTGEQLAGRFTLVRAEGRDVDQSLYLVVVAGFTDYDPGPGMADQDGRTFLLIEHGLRGGHVVGK